MIEVTVARNRDNAIKMFEVRGHSGFDEAGRDIVCAAVSVTAYNAAGALSELAGIEKCHTESPGFMKIELPDDTDAVNRQVADTIMNTTYIGFRQIESSYPAHLRVCEKGDKKIC